MLANLEEWGGYRGLGAEALLTCYGLPERAVGFPVLRRAGAGLHRAGDVRHRRRARRGEDAQEAVRAALALHADEIAFWDALADRLG